MKIIKLSDANYIVVDESKINEGDRIKPLSLKQVEEAIYGYSVKKMAEDYTEKWCGKRKVDIYIHDAFEAGFNAHKEISDKLFTIEDAYLIWKAGQEYYNTSGASITFEELIERRNELLPTKTEWECTIDEQGKITLIWK